MTLRTKADLRTKALQLIGVLSAGESASGDDVVYVDAVIQDILETLDDESLLIFDAQATTSDSVIPARLFNGLVDLVIYRIGAAYGREVGPDRWQDGMRSIRRAVLPGSDDAPVKATFY